MDNKNKNKFLPEIGKIYHFYDDGKIRLSRHELVTIENIIPFEELPVEKQSYIREKVEIDSWLNIYDNDIEYVVYGKTNMAYENEFLSHYPFIRQICDEGDNLWFGIPDCEERNTWTCEGVLDVNNRLTNQLINEISERSKKTIEELKEDVYSKDLFL